MKKVIKITIIIILVALTFHACVKKDVQEKETISIEKVLQAPVIFPEKPKNVTINGIDYRQSQTPIGIYGGKLVSSTIGEGPKTFNPFNTKDATSSTMVGIMYDGLITTDAKTGEIIPKLAKSYSISKDGLTYTINLRHGITWTDGKPITADDVLFTWKDIIFKGLGDTSTRDSILIDGKLPTIKKIDNYTVQFKTIKPFAPFLRNLSTPIAPKHVFEKVVKTNEETFNNFLNTTTPPKTMVTSGAFKLKEYVPAQRIVFERNPNYYEIDKAGNKLPYLDKLVYLIVGDLNNEILKFEAGEIDEISLKGSTVGTYKKREKNSNYKIFNIGADTGTMFVSINLNTRKDKNGKYYVPLKKQIWFNDKNFRTAIDYAIDRNAMVNNIANGLATPLFTAESLNSIYLNKKLKDGHEKDLNKSKSYLKQSGFYLNNKTLYDKAGNKVEIDLFTNAGNTEREAIGVMVKQDLEELGMKVNFKPIEFNSLVNKLVNNPNYDLVIMGLTGSPLEPHSGKNVWYSFGSLHLFNQRTPQDKANDVLPWEKELDKIIDNAALKIKFEERKKLYDKYQEIIYDEKPLIYLYSPQRVIALRKKFANIYPSSLSGVTYNIDEIFIKK